MAMARRTATTIRNNPSPLLPIRTKKAESPRSLPFFISLPPCRAADTFFLKAFFFRRETKNGRHNNATVRFYYINVPLERITDGKVETYAGVEAGNAVPAAAAGVVRRVQADAHGETDDDEVEVVAQARARADGRFGLSPRLRPRFSIRGLYFAFTGGLLCAAVLYAGRFYKIVGISAQTGSSKK